MCGKTVKKQRFTAVFHRKTPVLGSLFNKVAPATFFKKILKRDSNTSVSCGYCKIFKIFFFYRTALVAASDSPTTVSKVSWGVCSLILHLHMLSILIKNLHKTLHK